MDLFSSSLISLLIDVEDPPSCCPFTFFAHMEHLSRHLSPVGSFGIFPCLWSSLLLVNFMDLIQATKACTDYDLLGFVWFQYFIFPKSFLIDASVDYVTE